MELVLADLTAPSFSDFSRVRFFGSLDGLRALSILGVLWTHVWYVSGLEYYNRLQHYPVLKMGAFGVDAAAWLADCHQR